MTETLLARLSRKLAEVEADKAEHKNVQDVLVDEGTHLDPVDGSLSGGLAFRVRDGGGVWHVIHHERMDRLHRAIDLDDALARGFSIFLMKHPSWPK